MTQGIAPSCAVLEVIRVSQQHRGLCAVCLGGKAEAADARRAKAIEVEAAIGRFAQALETTDAKGQPGDRTLG